VRTEDGAPAPGWVIAVRSVGLPAQPVEEFGTTSRFDGWYGRTVLPGEYEVAAQRFDERLGRLVTGPAEHVHVPPGGTVTVDLVASQG
jgi:hypothetical protein